MSVGGAITTTGGLLALIAAILFYGLPQPRWWAKYLKSVPYPAPWFCLALIIGGTVGVISGGIGAWINDKVTRVVDWASSHFVANWTGLSLGLIIAAVIAAFLVKRILRDQYDGRTFALGSGLVVFGAAIPGAVGAAVVWCLSGIAWVVGWCVAQAFGVG